MEFCFKFIMEKFDMKNILILLTVLGAGLFTAETVKAATCYRCTSSIECYLWVFCFKSQSCTEISCPIGEAPSI